MSAHFLLNLLNKLKSDKMQGFHHKTQGFYLYFATSLINSITQLLDSIYHMTLSLL